jgi:hypothetical protein
MRPSKASLLTQFVSAGGVLALLLSPGYAANKNNNNNPPPRPQLSRPAPQFHPQSQPTHTYQYQHSNTSGGTGTTYQLHRTYGGTGQTFTPHTTTQPRTFGGTHFQSGTGATNTLNTRTFGHGGTNAPGPTPQFQKRTFGGTQFTPTGHGVTGAKFGPHGTLGFRGANAQALRMHGASYSYRGHNYWRFYAPRYHWPHGYFYHRYEVGGFLPREFWLDDYVIDDWALFHLDDPMAGFEWVRYGPDILLINIDTGEVVQVIYDAFDETDAPPPDDDGE